MSKVVGDIAVTVGADVSGLTGGMKKASKSVRRFGKDYDRTAERMRVMSIKMAKSMLAVGAAATTAFGAFAIETMKAAQELEKLSRLAGTNVEEFQRVAFAAEKFGIEQEKLADILKDTNDKVGDFLETGGGPLKDFFENIAPQVGLTAEKFRELSGPDALRAYVSALDAANLSHKELTFYMEALASDSTALLPLLRNGGKELDRLSDAAEKFGVVIDEDLIAGTARMNEVWTTALSRMQATFAKFASHIIIGLDNIYGLTESGQVHILNAESDRVKGAIAGAEEVVSLLDARIKAAKAAGNEALAGSLRKRRSEEGRALADLHAELGMVDATLEAISDRAEKAREALDDLHKPPELGEGEGDGGRGGGGGGLDHKDFDMFLSRISEEAEALDMWRAEQLEKLREFRDAKLATEEEYNQLEAQINRQHAEQMANIERRRQQANLQAWGTAFGDLASLAQSSNKKLFKIGQAAAVAEAVVSGYSAAVDAWAKGMAIGGPPVAAAFTAASLAKTTALIGGITSASSSGGGGTPNRGGGTSDAAITASQHIAIQLHGNSETKYSREAVLDMLNGINEALEDGAVLRFT